MRSNNRSPPPGYGSNSPPPSYTDIDAAEAQHNSRENENAAAAPAHPIQRPMLCALTHRRERVTRIPTVQRVASPGQSIRTCNHQNRIQRCFMCDEDRKFSERRRAGLGKMLLFLLAAIAIILLVKAYKANHRLEKGLAQYREMPQCIGLL